MLGQFLHQQRSKTRFFHGFYTYVWLFAGLFVVYLIVSPLVSLPAYTSDASFHSYLLTGDVSVRLSMAVALVALALLALVFRLRGVLTTSRAIIVLIAAGIVMRFGTMLYTPFFIHGHDVGSFDDYGHLAYAFNIFNGNGLPDSNWGQFYHPPFAHIADAIVAKAFALITGQTDNFTIFEAARLVPCFASCALLIVSVRTFTELAFPVPAKLVASALVAFHPTFFITAASINNDMLMTLFVMAAFLYTIRWYKNQTYKNILLIAVFIGAAMSTKFSGALVAVYTAVVFLIVLIRRTREKTAVPLLAQYGAFAAVCFPLGLWYHIRNLILFGQAPGYVARIPETSGLYTGDHPLLERLFGFSLPDMLQRVYCSPWDDYRLPEYVVMCALYGEFWFSDAHRPLGAVLIVVSLILIVLSLGAMVWFVFFDRKTNRLAVLSFGGLWLILMLSYVFFYIQYPFGCTLDFRYILPTVITGAAFLGLGYDALSHKRRGKIPSLFLVGVLTVFCVLSAAFYII